MFTSLLFNIGAFLIGLYLGWIGVSSVFGAMGAFVAVLLWVYYSAQIVFFGAKFTQVYAASIGQPILPSKRVMSLLPPSST